MQEPGTPEIGLGRAALIATFVLAVITIIAKLQTIGRWLRRLAAWGGRTLVWALIHSDSEKSREALAKLQDPERAAVRQRLDALESELAALRSEMESQFRAARRYTSDVGGLVVELEGKVQAMRDEMAKERSEFRGDLAVATTRMENVVRDLRRTMDRTSEQTNATLHKVNTALHTILGAQLGPDAARDVLREAHARQDDDTEG